VGDLLPGIDDCHPNSTVRQMASASSEDVGSDIGPVGGRQRRHPNEWIVNSRFGLALPDTTAKL
jgi:hypothetical protein